MARRRGRRTKWAAVIGAGVALALVGYLTVRFIRPAAPGACTAHGRDGTSVTLGLDQAAHAATIAAVAHARGLPERAVTIALAAAIQESKLRNLTYGDRDSVGLFQQRPSEGWGSPAQIKDPVYAAGKFFDALVKVPGYLHLPVTAAAQQVQHSGYPDAYARRETMATTLADVLTGQEGPALNCRMNGTDPDPAPSTATSTTAGAATKAGDTVTAAVRREFGDTPGALPATGGAGISYPIPAHHTSTGWSLALWLVCHATDVHATSVTYDGRRWNRTTADRGWTRTASEAGQTGTPAVTVL